jgi:hypothetical protein
MIPQRTFVASGSSLGADATILRVLLSKMLAIHGEVTVREIVEEEVRSWCRVTKMPEPMVEWSPPEPQKGAHVFCTQCDRLVRAAEGQSCTAPFCKAKE